MTIEEQIMKLQTYKMYEGEDTVYVERDDVLKALEQTRWIPVGERLPEEVGAYLLSLHIEAPMCKPLNRVVKGYWTTSDKFRFETESGVVAKYYVFAWMPLPQPYKAEGEVE